MSEILTLSRMARRVGVPVDWLREQADAGRVPVLRAGARHLFNPQAVIDALSVMAARSAGRDSWAVGTNQTKTNANAR